MSPAPPLRSACERVGLSVTGARLLHRRANAVYHLPAEGVIVRLRATRGSSEWERRLASATRITQWLSTQAFPTVTPRFVDPVSVDGWTATFWNYVRFARKPSVAGPAELARLLRRLHEMPKAPIELVKTNPLGSLLQDLGEAAHRLSDEQRDWLNVHARRVAAAYPETSIPLGVGIIHGDAHGGNLFPAEEGYLFGDWDSVSVGPRAQDLVPTLDGLRHFGSPPSHWNEFCDAYDVDPEIMDDPGMRLLLRARELRSLAAYIRSADRDDIKAELNKRLRTLMFDEPSIWRAL
jgi:hypothetical protein